MKQATKPLLIFSMAKNSVLPEKKLPKKTLPKVTVVVPTYNRHAFIPQLLHCIRQQDYPSHLVEVLIFDDSPEPLKILPEAVAGMNFTLFTSPTKVPLGQKRNFLNDKATGEITVVFDDDDYYPPTRISHAVERLQTSGKPLASSTLLFMWFPNTEGDSSLYLLGPYGDNHSCNGAMAYTKDYLKTARYDDSKTQGEEPAFTNNFRNDMVQLDPLYTMCAIAHHQNTVAKKVQNFANARLPNPQKFPQYPFTSWLDIIKDEQSRDFYRKMFGLKT